MYDGKYITRPIDQVMRDIKRIKELGYNSFYLIDDNIASNPRYLMQLTKRIKPLKMKWSSQCTVNIAKNKKLLNSMVDSGCQILSFGIESITQVGIDKLNKSWLKVDEHLENLSIIEKAGILLSTEMILGTDSDTEESIKETCNFINKAGIPIPRFYILTPMPSTELYEEYKAEGRLIHENYIEYDGTRCVHVPKNITPEKLTKMYWWLYKNVFSLRSILRRTIFKKKFLANPRLYLFAFFVNLHYRKYILKGNVPNIF